MDNALRIALGMLLGSGVFPLATLLRLLLKASFVNLLLLFFIFYFKKKNL